MLKLLTQPLDQFHGGIMLRPLPRTPSGQYILDPAINPERPTPLKDWILKQVGELKSAEVTLCTPQTFSPYSDCESSEFENYDSVIEGQKHYLDSEEFNLEILGFDKDAYLGDHPPWISA